MGGFKRSGVAGIQPGCGWVCWSKVFVYASVNMRGGGEVWREMAPGWVKREETETCSMISSGRAKWLVANKYTSREKLAIQGGSNGGLLMGAVINQRPELYRAAVAQAGVMDMLRFQKFTIGVGLGWRNTDRAIMREEFKDVVWIFAAANVRAGVRYPATLITTGRP